MTSKVSAAQLIMEAVSDLNRKWVGFRDDAQFPQLTYLREKCATDSAQPFSVRFNETGFPAGSAGDFIFDSAGGQVVLHLSDKFLGAWAQLLKSVSDERLVALALKVFVVHELVHKPQQLTSSRHQDIRNAPSPLTALDYHADMIAAIAVSYLEGCKTAAEWAEIFKATFYAAMVFDLRERNPGAQAEEKRVYSVGRLRRLFLLLWQTCRLLRIGNSTDFVPARMQFLHMPSIDFRNTRPISIARYHSRLRLETPQDTKAGTSLHTGDGPQHEEELYFQRLRRDITPNLDEIDFRRLVGLRSDIENPSQQLPLLWLVFLDGNGFPAVVRVKNEAPEALEQLVQMLFGADLGPALWVAAGNFMRIVFDQANGTLMLPGGKATYVVNHLSGSDED